MTRKRFTIFGIIAIAIIAYITGAYGIAFGILAACCMAALASTINIISAAFMHARMRINERK